MTHEGEQIEGVLKESHESNVAEPVSLKPEVKEASIMTEAARQVSIMTQAARQASIMTQAARQASIMTQAAKHASIMTEILRSNQFRRFLDSIRLDKELTRLTESVIKPLNFDFVPGMKFENVFDETLSNAVDLYFDDETPIINELRLIDNRIVTPNEAYSKDDIKEAMRDVILETGMEGSLINIQDLLSRILQIVQVLLKRGNGGLGLVILTLVLNFISTNVVDPLYEQIKNILASSANPQEAVKRLNKETTKEMGVDATLIKGYRFVSANTLPVFERAARQSKRINELKFGQVVQILREHKDWVLVEWRSDEGLEGRGWVYTRYLKRFN